MGRVSDRKTLGGRRHGPDWMILTVQSGAEAVPTRVRGPRDNLYTQVAPFEGLRGREPHWHLYRAERRNRSPRAR